MIYTIEYIKNEFMKHKCILLNNTYKNRNSPLKYTCEFNHENIKTWDSFKDLKHKCVTCAKTTIIKPNKYTLEEIQEKFKSFGYELISTEYNNQNGKLQYKCEKGHLLITTFATLLYQHHGCKICNNRIPPTIESIKKEFDEAGITLLSTEYNNSKSKLHYVCEKNHHCYSTLSNWRNMDTDCGTCGRELANKNLRHTYNDVINILKIKNYELLTTPEEYNIIDNSTDKIKFKCDKGHNNEAILFNITRHACSICAKRKKFTYEEVKAEFEKYGYEMISMEYINKTTHLDVLCPKKHKCRVTYAHFRIGSRCFTCCPNSKGEERIKEYLVSKQLDFIPEKKFPDCKNIRELLFDFYINNKFIIEYDGRQHFYSSDLFGGEKEFLLTQKRDKIKTDYCRNNNIPLLRICFTDYKNIDTILDDFIKHVNTLKPNEGYIYFSRPKMYEYLK